MGQTLTNGVYLPDNGERNCYTGLSQNWQKLDNLIGSHGDSVSFSQTLTEGVEIGKITINGTELSMYHTDYSSKADASNVYTKTEIDTSLSSKADASDLTTHTSNTDIHVTSTDKSTWNGKQSALSTAQLNACNSGITSTKVSSYDTHVANSDVHVTTSDKSTWNAKQNSLTDTQLSACNSGITSDKVSQYDGYATSKANDSNVVHKSGNETINGQKILSSSPKVITKYPFISINNSECDIASTPSETLSATLYFSDKNGKNLSYITSQQRASGENRTCYRQTKTDVDGYYSVCLSTNGSFYPEQHNTINLGISSNKWKTINGINPGALSLPSNTGVVDILSTLQTTGFTALKDGWIRACKNTQDNVASTFGIRNESTSIESRSIAERVFIHHCYLPVKAGEKIIISDDWENASNVTKTYYAYFYPCQGNV